MRFKMKEAPNQSLIMLSKSSIRSLMMAIWESDLGSEKEEIDKSSEEGNKIDESHSGEM